ncbi:hypothetical protein D3C71_908220 [compost metagenome]
MVGIHHFNHMKRADRADTQLAGIELARVVQQVEGIQFQRAQLLGHGQQRHADLRQLRAAPTAMKQFHLVLFFQRLDLGGHRGLRQAQRTGACAETTVTRDGQEGAQAGNRHIDSIYG